MVPDVTKDEYEIISKKPFLDDEEIATIRKYEFLSLFHVDFDNKEQSDHMFKLYCQSKRGNRWKINIIKRMIHNHNNPHAEPKTEREIKIRELQIQIETLLQMSIYRPFDFLKADKWSAFCQLPNLNEILIKGEELIGERWSCRSDTLESQTFHRLSLIMRQIFLVEMRINCQDTTLEGKRIKKPRPESLGCEIKLEWIKSFT